MGRASRPSTAGGGGGGGGAAGAGLLDEPPQPAIKRANKSEIEIRIKQSLAAIDSY